MKKTLWTAGLFALFLVGCTDPSEQFDGPGGCRRQPVVYGGTRFAGRGAWFLLRGRSLRRGLRRGRLGLAVVRFVLAHAP